MSINRFLPETTGLLYCGIFEATTNQPLDIEPGPWIQEVKNDMTWGQSGQGLVHPFFRRKGFNKINIQNMVDVPM